MSEPRYRFSVDHTDDNGYTTFGNTLEFTAEQLPDVVGNFELFLKGSGFVFMGHVDITEDSTTDNSYSNKDWRTFNNLPDVKADSDYFAQANEELRETADIHVKRPADTEGGSLE
jgi:hypothetical protein